MNFLAHLYLSGDSEQLMVGNFMGDFVKGKRMHDYSPEITRGIFLHREIDFFTDNHPIVALSKQRLYATFHHYAGVLVDMFYDHMLAKNWERFSTTTLEAFAKRSYAVLDRHKALLPEKARFMLPYMKRDNWLLNYREPDGIARALQGMERRTKFESKLGIGIHALQTDYASFEKEFLLFFPALIQHVQQLK